MSGEEWVELFTDPNLKPDDLSLLISAPGFVPALSSVGQIAKDYFSLLWENPSFALLILEDPSLGALAPFVEQAWITDQSSEIGRQLALADLPDIRERSMALMEEVMTMAWSRMHPLVYSLWAGRFGFPCFKRYPNGGDWPQQAWHLIFQHNRHGESTTLESTARQVICALMYDHLDGWVYRQSIRARYLVDCPPKIDFSSMTPAPLEKRRLWLAAERHLLDHVANGAPLDWDVLRASEELP